MIFTKTTQVSDRFRAPSFVCNCYKHFFVIKFKIKYQVKNVYKVDFAVEKTFNSYL